MSAPPHPLRIPLRALNGALQEQMDLGRKMLTLADEQTDALTHNDLARLTALEAEGGKLMTQHALIERKRMSAADALAHAVNYEGETEKWTISEIVPRLPRTEARKLLASREALLTLQQEIQTVNRRNCILLQNARDFVQVTMETLAQLAAQSAGYGPSAVAFTVYVDRKA